jgi:hypothetical protein
MIAKSLKTVAGNKNEKRAKKSGWSSAEKGTGISFQNNTVKIRSKIPTDTPKTEKISRKVFNVNY